ncbi:hypothetical protein ES703_31234 [subsurface metagenome]
MFNKKNKDKDMKIMEGDVGFAEDSFASMKQAIGAEEHYFGDFIISRKKEDFESYNHMRKIRSNLQNNVLKTLNIKLKNQGWCKMKHICGVAMHVQELCARTSNFKLLEISNLFAEIHKLLYLEYLNILGFTEKNISNKSGA